MFLFLKFWIEPSKPVFQVPWFLIGSKNSANIMQQQSHSSLPHTTLCQKFRMPVWFTNFWCSSKKIVIISARHSLRSVEVKFPGTISFPTKRSSAYWTVKNFLSCIVHYARVWLEYISYQTIIMNELGLTFEPECHDLMSHRILLFIIVQSIF